MADRWQSLQTLYLAALEQPEARRAAWVREQAHPDDELADQVLALLSAEPPELMDRPDALAELAGAALAESAPERRIGPYRIEAEVGRGGMGTVYRARRTDGVFERTVALKLVKPGMDTEAVLRRFRAERQILARLDHPGIARVFDGGRAPSGRPWLAMEYVEGVPITTYADRHRLSVAERLVLFGQVCEAVAYAHRRLVVHRDLKPSNVLVTAEGRVKLLDFGIAKVLGGAGGEPLATMTGPDQLTFTPEYAAPEQVAGESISTATDVYALGVVLYELLAGQRPYHFDARTPAVVDFVVRTVEPPRPSTVAARAPAPTETARGLRRRLAGDLDTICLTALRKEPERRYASVDALADDLRRHAQGLPVAAQPDTLGYRSRKFARRHRTWLSAVAAALVAVAAVTAVAFDRVASERDRARLEARKAEQVASLLAGLFRDADPSAAQGDSLLVVDALDRGASRVRRELSGQPEVQGATLRVIGEVYTALGRFDQADSILSQALALHRGASPDEEAATLSALGALRRYAGAYASADSLFRAALALARAQGAPGAASVPTHLVNVGGIRYDLGDYARADSFGRLALAAHNRQPEPDALGLADAYSFLGVVALDFDQDARADSLHRLALELREQHLSAPHEAIAQALLNAGLSRRTLSHYDDAEDLLTRSLEMRRALYGDAHPDVAYTYNHLASLAYDRQDFAAAEAYARQGLAIREAVFGPTHIEVGASLGNLARLQRAAGNPDGARATLERVLAIVLETVGPQHPFVGAVHGRIAAIDAERGRAVQAELGYRRALELFRATWPGGHANVARTARALGGVVAATRPAQARALYDEALASCPLAPDPDECARQTEEALAAVKKGAGR